MSWTGALALLLTIAGADRSSVDVSFGWRFALAGTPACNATSFPISMDNIQVYDMSEISTAQSPDECRAAACTNLADVWQWCPGNGLACGAKSCWVGPWTNSTNPQNGWVSARRNTVPTPLPTPPEAAPSFPDASWDLVDLPHDFEVTGVFDPNDNNNEGSLPWNTSFYRKHFVLPASWAGTRIELYVGGALSASQWWLNGKPLGGGQEYMSSYTAIVLRLDDSPAIVPGGANVICGYVDGTKKTGWWCVTIDARSVHDLSLQRLGVAAAASHVGRAIDVYCGSLVILKPPNIITVITPTTTSTSRTHTPSQVRRSGAVPPHHTDERPSRVLHCHARDRRACEYHWKRGAALARRARGRAGCTRDYLPEGDAQKRRCFHNRRRRGKLHTA